MITKLAFHRVSTFTPCFKSKNFKNRQHKIDTDHMQYRAKANTDTFIASFRGLNQKTQENAEAKEFDAKSMPFDVASVYSSAQDMANLMKKVEKRAKRAIKESMEEKTNLKHKINDAIMSYNFGQRVVDGTLVRKINASIMNPDIIFMTETKNDGKTVTRRSSFIDDTPIRIEEFNEDGSTNIITFANKKVSSYEKGKRKTDDGTITAKILTFENGKLKDYKTSVTTSNKDKNPKTTVAKSLEFEGIGTSYKEGISQNQNGETKTDIRLFLVYEKPWYFETEIAGIPKKIQKRMEFSNEEKTAYSYQEDVIFDDDLKFIGKSLYLKDNIPYRYCENERAIRFPSANYENTREISYIDGKWVSVD